MQKLTVVSAAALAFMAAWPVRADEHGSDVAIAMRRVEAQDTAGGIQSLLAPGTPVPKIGPNGNVLDYVRWAKSSLDRGQNAEAELSLEWGQVRRRVDEQENAFAMGQIAPTYDARCTRSMCKAMRSIGFGNAAAGRQYLNAALAEFAQEDRPYADYADPVEGGAASTMDTEIRKGSASLAQLSAPRN